MVAIEERNYPELAAIRVSLDEATATDSPPPRLTIPVGRIEPALQVEFFEISGRPVRVQQAAIDLWCVAEKVEIGQGRDADGNLLLVLQNAAHGRVEISVPLADLQTLVRAAATAAAARQGVILEDLQLRVRSQTQRSLDLEVQARARKLFLSTGLRLRGRVEIDDQLDAHVSGLDCVGEGTLGTLACGVLGPYLERFNEGRFSLLALPLGELKLHDIRIALDQKLHLTAQFGSDVSA